MSDSADRAADLEQQYVGEYTHDEGLVEGLDPARSGDEQSAEQVKAAAPDSETEREIDRMADRD